MNLVWTRPRNIHPYNYKANKELYPLGSQASSYDVQMKGVTFRKYNKMHYAQKEKNYRALSMPMHLKARFANVMKVSGDVFYNDMVGEYIIQYVCLKLSYKDCLELMKGLKKEEINEK